MQILFNKTIEQCRRLGARGGRAHARNLRLSTSPAAVAALADSPGRPSETTHHAIAMLDAQFPWLCGAEKRTPPRRPQP